METTQAVTYEQLLNLFERSKIEFDELFKATNEMFRKSKIETDEKIKELGVQIGGLGNKFGLYNEGLFMPSLIKIVEGEFNCDFYTNNTKIKNNGNSFEIDFWGTSASACYLIEVKSNLKSDAIRQMEKTIQLFRNSFPEHAKRNVYGAIATTHYSEEAKQKVIKAGFYFISISDEVAKLSIPNGFKPQNW